MNPKLSVVSFLVVSIPGIVSFPLATDLEGKPHSLGGVECNVGIVGGGISGLYMAYRLLKSGKENRVCIFEKTYRVGGKLFDIRFKEAPDIYVGLGAWRVDKKQANMIDLMNELSVQYADWPFIEPNLFESRGIKANNPEDIKQGFPSLLADPVFGNMTRGELFGYLLRFPFNVGYTTANTFASNFITAEGLKYITELTFHKGEFDISVSPESFMEFQNMLGSISGKYIRPKRGMSAIITQLQKAVEAMGGKIFLNTEVKSLSRTTDNKWFAITTSKASVTTKKLIIATTPKQLKNVRGSIAERIQETEQFRSIQPIPAFKGAAVYDHAWWENVEVAGTRIKAGQRFYSHSNCLGLTLPHRGKGFNGEAVLHTMYNDGDCAKRWNDIKSLGKTYIDREVHRALETKYGAKIPKPINTTYYFWESAWHFQKAGTPFTFLDISNWAKRPLQGLDVFLVGAPYNPMRAWCEGVVLSGKNALQEGWGIRMDEKGRQAFRNMETKKDIDEILSKGIYDFL